MEKAWSDSRQELWGVSGPWPELHPQASTSAPLFFHQDPEPCGAGSSEGNVFAVLASALLSSTLVNQAFSCGHERSDIKTLFRLPTFS